MTFEELRQVLVDENGDPLTKFVLLDTEENAIYAEDLHILDAYALREWQVLSVKVQPDGCAEITLNSGDFVLHHFHSVIPSKKA